MQLKALHLRIEAIKEKLKETKLIDCIKVIEQEGCPHRQYSRRECIENAIHRLKKKLVVIAKCVSQKGVDGAP